MLPGAYWAILHKDFIFAMLSQEYGDNIEQFFFLSNFLDNIAQGLYLC